MLRAARIRSSLPLLYAEGADPSIDRGPHVRAGSGAAFVRTKDGERLAICQDDAAFLALVDLDATPALVHVSALTLPAGPGGVRQFEKARGNKMDKLDLESACVLPTDHGTRLFLFGSGSAPIREVVVEVDVEAGTVEVLSAGALFAALRDRFPFAEINVEGACLVGGDLDLFQRGNGKGGVNAIVRLPWRDLYASLRTGSRVELLAELVDLGRVQDTPLTFTDACAHDGRVFFLAAAEQSPNAIDDGDVVGCAIGTLDGARVTSQVPLLLADGTPYLGKPEGLAIRSDGRAYVVNDADDPTTPSSLLSVELE